MAKSALYAIRNGTVTFQVSGSGTQVDPRTGNVIDSKQSVSYEVYIESGSSSPGSSVAKTGMPGADVFERFLVAYVVSPKILDSKIIRGTKCTLTHGRVTSEAIVRDIAYPYGESGLGALVNNVVGTKVVLEQVWGN